MIRKIDFWLEQNETRNKIAKEGCKLAHREFSYQNVIKQLLNLGFEAITVTARADVLNEEWLGRRIDLDFLDQINELKGIMAFTPGGKAGVYHTTVLNGPIFNYGLEIKNSSKELRNGFWFLNVLEVEKRSKQRLLSLAHSV